MSNYEVNYEYCSYTCLIIYKANVIKIKSKKQMIVKPAKKTEWKLLREHGDIRKIVELSKVLEKARRIEAGPAISAKNPIRGISHVTIGHALRTGVMAEKTFEVINRFYHEKKLKQDALQKNTAVELETD
jgi:hypothetical protein